MSTQNQEDILNNEQNSEELPLEEELIDITQEVDELEQVMAERDDYRDRFMRALAEAENARKRADKDKREAEHYGSTRLVRDLMPVYDNLQRAITAIEADETQKDSPMAEGITLTLRELVSVMEKHGVNFILPNVGDRFDPRLHEAMFEAPLPDTKAGDIIQVSAVGFKLHDRLLRPAQVGVSSFK